jgi:DNA-binding transcriptional regulator/RsmH inhibitor MraZ
MRFLASPLAMSAVLIAATLAACAHPLSMRDIDAAIGARDASQWSEFQSRMRAISARHPGQPTFRYLLAQAAARNDDDFAAIGRILLSRDYDRAPLSSRRRRDSTRTPRSKWDSPA